LFVFQSASANALPRGLEDDDFLSGLQKYVQESEVDVTIPEGMSVFSGTQFSFSPRNIDEDELSLKVKLPASEDAKSVGEGKHQVSEKINILVVLNVNLVNFTFFNRLKTDICQSWQS